MKVILEKLAPGSALSKTAIGRCLISRWKTDGANGSVLWITGCADSCCWYDPGISESSAGHPGRCVGYWGSTESLEDAVELLLDGIQAVGIGSCDHNVGESGLRGALLAPGQGPTPQRSWPRM